MYIYVAAILQWLGCLIPSRLYDYCVAKVQYIEGLRKSKKSAKNKGPWIWIMKLISSLNRKGGGWLPGGVPGPLQGLAAGTQHSHTRFPFQLFLLLSPLPLLCPPPFKLTFRQSPCLSSPISLCLPSPLTTSSDLMTFYSLPPFLSIYWILYFPSLILCHPSSLHNLILLLPSYSATLPLYIILHCSSTQTLPTFLST